MTCVSEWRQSRYNPLAFLVHHYASDRIVGSLGQVAPLSLVPIHTRHAQCGHGDYDLTFNGISTDIYPSKLGIYYIVKPLMTVAF